MVKVEHKTDKHDLILKVGLVFVDFTKGKADVSEELAEQIKDLKNYQLVKPEKKEVKPKTKPIVAKPERKKPGRKPKKK